MNPDKVICPCKKVTKGQVLEAMKAGATSFRQVSEATGAGSKCGHCKDDIKKFMKKHRDKVKAAAETQAKG